MKIIVNGEGREITAAILDRALEELGYNQARIATAINGLFIPMKQRGRTSLKDGDMLDVVAPMQGG
jgi:sulfur carrier protein